MNLSQFHLVLINVEPKWNFLRRFLILIMKFSSGKNWKQRIFGIMNFLRTGNGVIMMNEVSIDVSCSYQTNYVVEIATNVIAEDQSVDLDEHDGEFQFGIMVRILKFVTELMIFTIDVGDRLATSVMLHHCHGFWQRFKNNLAWRRRKRSIQCW